MNLHRDSEFWIDIQGFSAANAQALSAPPYIFACFCLIFCGWFSDKYKMRMVSCVVPSIVAFM